MTLAAPWADVDGFFRELGIDLPTRGTDVPAPCPNADAHRRGDRSPSASVNRRTGAWQCHTSQCGAKGGAYDAAIYAGKSPAQAMELVERFGLKREKDDDARPRSTGHDPVVATYVYEDETGKPLFRVNRT